MLFQPSFLFLLENRKTVVIGGKPWKLQLELNYLTEKADSIGPEWMIGFNIATVVENVLIRWFR